MEKNLPTWLNVNFLKLALSDGNEKIDTIQIKNHSVEPVVESGNNYCSTLYRVKTQYSRKETKNVTSRSFIIKAPLTDGSEIQNIVNDANLLKNEYNMYKKIFPEMYNIYKHKFTPKSYYCELENVLVLEDLKEAGYNMCDRRKQLDFSHCRQFIVTIAKYHATTIALHNKEPELVESNGNEPFYNTTIGRTEKLQQRHEMNFITIANIIEKYEGMQPFATAIRRHYNSLTEVFIKLFSRRGKINVLNHGDCWVNNMLFKYDKDGNVADCRLIDFQIRRYGSPVIDLLYFMFTSTRKEVREKHMTELFNIYRETLNETLSELSCTERLTVEDFREELRQMCPLALLIVTTYLPLILNEPEMGKESNIQTSEESQKSKDVNINPYLKHFQGQTYNKVLPDLCKDLISLGVLEYLTNDC